MSDGPRGSRVTKRVYPRSMARFLLQHDIRDNKPLDFPHHRNLGSSAVMSADVSNLHRRPPSTGATFWEKSPFQRGAGQPERCHARLATLPHERGGVPAGGQDMSVTISRSHSRCCDLLASARVPRRGGGGIARAMGCPDFAPALSAAANGKPKEIS
jgi:hypothetical protein